MTVQKISDANRIGNVWGCWFCREKTGDFLFSFEFDTPVHFDCAKKAHDEGNPEGTIMLKEWRVLDGKA